MTRRELFLHVGSSKTGTSALQLALWNSTDALARSGLGLPLVGRGASVRHLLRPLGWDPISGFHGSIDADGLDHLATLLRETPGDRLLISNENLAEATPTQIAAVREVAELAELDVRVVVTARDWAKQVPSEWQQLLKHRIATDYETYLERVRKREGVEGETFWRRQDFAGICDLWGSGLDPAHVHLVVVPSASVDKDAVFRVFSELAGFDVASLTIDRYNVNLSFGYVEAEMLRRLNLALEGRLLDYEKAYMPAVRRILVRRVIARGLAPRITLPPAHVPWVRDVTGQRLARVLERGYTVHGDHSLLAPDAASVGPLPEIDEAAMAASAIRTLADFAVAVFEEEKTRRKARRRSTPQGAGPDASAERRAPPHHVGRVRRLMRRWRS